MKPAKNFRDRVAAHFRLHPGRWIDGDHFRYIGGKYAYRTRISECRRELHMTIENRKRQVDGVTVSEYRYMPAEEPVLRAHDLNGGFALR